MTNLFQASGLEEKAPRPLADKLRPTSLSQVAGQGHLIGPQGKLHRFIKSKKIPSIILWGPPGSGKTTIARLLASETNLYFEQLSAIFAGVNDLRKVFEQARFRREEGKGTLLFIDEIHRFNRAQQDSFLPYMEDGTITLIGATTENPSFELNSALLSRSNLITLKRLDSEALEQLLSRAEIETSQKLPLDDDARSAIIEMSDGDGRALLNLAEEIFVSFPRGTQVLSRENLAEILQKRAPLYDKNKDSHYNLISALHKSVRGSDPDAALYWFARMLIGGEDPVFIARRLVRMSVEDIGLADPQAMIITIAAKDAYEFLGTPEGELALAEAVIYLATAPKSNANYKAYKKAVSDAKEYGSLVPPNIILNAPNTVMEQQGYGDGYIYDHDTSEAFSGQNYFPEKIKQRPDYYEPTKRGFEVEIQKRLDHWKKMRNKRS
ncbi:MAG: replication-associated recombination protein A [Hyphomicrobium sp.]